MILQRLPGEHFSEVVPEWSMLTVVVIACGPSLMQDQVVTIRAARALGRCKVIAVNDAYLWAPWADAHYAADSHWHRWHEAGIAKPALGLTAAEVRERWAAFSGEKCSIQSSGGNITHPAVHILRNRTHPKHAVGLSTDRGALVTGLNSGFQALNLAVLAGAKRVLLVGFDGSPGPDGREHFHGGHPRPTPAAAYPLYREAMSAARPALQLAGVEVLNCTPGSAIDAFPMADLTSAL
jgi:hypothetical protein